MQHSQMSCSIDGLRMAIETVGSDQVHRTSLRDHLIQRGVYTNAGGAYFDALDRALELFPSIAGALKVSNGPNDILAQLRGGNSVALVRCQNNGQGHCVVVDFGFTVGQNLFFQVRDPAQQGTEPNVAAADPRIAGQRRFWLLSS